LLHEFLTRIGALYVFVNRASKEKFAKVTYDELLAAGYKQGWNFLKPKDNVILEDFPRRAPKPQVPNDSTQDLPLILVSGSNMSGKTHFLIQDFYIQLLAQSLGFCPLESGNFRIYKGLIYLDRVGVANSRMLSAFGAELLNRWKSAYDLADKYTKIWSDEGFSTTSSEDQFRLVSAHLLDFAGKGVRIILANHNETVIRYFRDDPRAAFYHFSIEVQGKKVNYHHQLFPGPGDAHALEVARACGLPASIIRRDKT
jgi:DNA mismatch repair protein MutS